MVGHKQLIKKELQIVMGTAAQLFLSYKQPAHSESESRWPTGPLYAILA